MEELAAKEEEDSNNKTKGKEDKEKGKKDKEKDEEDVRCSRPFSWFNIVSVAFL